MELELPDEARALLDAVVAIGSDLDLHGVLRRIVESSCALTHAQYGVLAMVDDDGSFVDLVVHGMSDETLARIGRPPEGLGLLGLVPRLREPVRIDHVEDHPVFGGLPEGHPPIDRFLGAPVLMGERAFGHLYLGNGPDSPAFTARDQALVEVLGRAAGVMINNARAFEQSERHRGWMQGVARVATALAPSLQEDLALNAMAEQVREMSGARAVALIDAASERLEITACAGGGQEDLMLTVKEVADEIARAAGGELVEIRTDSGVATLAIPVRTELAPAAVLLVDEASAWRQLDGVERDVISALADHAGLTLDRAHALRERHELLLAKDRDRIARDLHDLVIQRLFATGMQLQGARNLGSPAAVSARIDEAVAELDVAIGDLRATIYELGRGGEKSLLEDVRALIGEYAPLIGFLPLLRLSGQVERSLTPEATDSLLLTLRESLSNLMRHAHATSAKVELTASAGWVTLRVSDDGVGFDPVAIDRRSGLDNARHRAEALGGHFTIESAHGAGCRAEWVVPAIA
ncbi:GAF domain-containing sensor histidine kinase [Nocardioides pelophilus]|uniref:GAF domain-containing sensor histidine kinase n=1 Tax=Nocardioides pelophilus TaxID=2172019 RepID=UPI0016019908|nr:GAF domain-containing sensor histidine kinase [Nocardioides pelophilus]